MSMRFQLSRRELGIAAAFVVAGLVAWFLLRDGRLPADEAVHQLVDKGIAAAEEGDVGDLMDLVSERYGSDGNGPENRAELRSYLTALLFRGGVDIEELSREVTLHDDRTATVALSLLLVRGGLRGMAEGKAGARDVELHLELEDGDWKVVSSRHETGLE